MSRNLTKQEIIRGKEEIDSVFVDGRRYYTSCFKIIIAPGKKEFSRLLVIPIKHYGNAVHRNKIRRQVKEIWRNLKTNITVPTDFVFIVYPKKVFTYEEMENSIISLLSKQNILRN